MLTADQLASSINAFSGTTAFVLDLLERDGEQANTLRLPIYYNNNVWKVATTWNKTAPCGVLGLGWGLGLDVIVADLHSVASPLATSYYVFSSGNSTPLVCTGSSGGVWTFAAENYAFWQISYEPASERWRIVKEDGVTYTLGDTTTGRSTVRWGVAWQNWRGSSSQLQGQRSVATGWQLAQITDLWGNTTTFTYEAVTQHVGTNPEARVFFTQASYLVGITGPNGEAAVLHYAEKDPSEYQNPHTQPAPPNAYQNYLETRYLSTVDYCDENSQTLFTMHLLYENAQQGPAFLGSGNLTKRLLTNVQRTWANGQALPDTQFLYYGQNSHDGVSATTIYNAPTQALYGALKMITLPEGGTVTFQYGKQTLPLCDLHVPISVPNSTGYTFSRPRFAFADDFVVALWYGEQAGGANPIAQVVAWTWEGRWLETTLAAIPLVQGSVYADIPLLVEDHFFGILSGQRLYLYQRHPAQIGQWVTPSVGTNPVVPYFTTAIPANEPTQLVAGERFAAVLGTTSGTVYRYRWNGSAWIADEVQTLSAGSSPALFAATASANYLFTCGSASTSADVLHLTLLALNQSGAWQQNAFTVTRSGNNLAQLLLQAGQSFVVLTERDTLGSFQVLHYSVCGWNETFTTLTTTDLGSLTFAANQTPTQAVIRGSAIAIGQRLSRFDGLHWNFQDLSQVALPSNATLANISYGFNQVLRSVQTAPGAYTYDLVVYDPNTATWARPTGMSANGASATVASRAARTKNLGSDFVIFNNKLYYQQPDATWAEELSIPDTLSGDSLASLQLLEERYALYQNGNDTKIYTLHNGSVANPSASLVLNGQQILVTATAPESLVGRRSFVTYTGTYGSSGSQLTLYRVLNEHISGAQVGYGISGVVINNGYQSIATGYSYEVAHATIDAAGLVPQFNLVTQIPGSTDPATTPAGTNAIYYFNGLSASEAPVLPYPVDAVSTNAPSYNRRMGGVIYSTHLSDAAGAIHATTVNYWMVYAKTLGQLGVGLYARLAKLEPMLDGVTGQIIHTYSADTGLLTQTSERNYNSAGIEELFVKQYKYFWEAYDSTRALNLLTPIIQSTARTQLPANSSDTITAIEVTTWQSNWGHGPGTWAPWQTFSARNANATFTHWQGGGDSDANWLLTSSIQARTVTGVSSLLKNVDGVASTNIVDSSSWYVTARFVNADGSTGEASYYGFESYEQLQGWGWTDPNGSLLSALTTNDFHTGTHCLQLLPHPNQQIGPLKIFQPTQQQVYIFSCWAKTPVGFNPASGAARWQFIAYRNDTNQQVGASVNLDLPATNNKWVYLQKTLDLAALRSANTIPPNVALYVVIQAYNQNSAQACLLDNLRLSALGSSFAATVYRPGDRQITATLGNNGETDRFIYDAYNRLIAQVGPEEKIQWLVALGYSRMLGGNTFLANFPNSLLQLRTTSDSLFYDFHDGSMTDWTGAGGTWAIVGGALTYTPSTPLPTYQLGGTATLNLFAFTNCAVRVTCTVQPGGTAGIGNGDVFFYWNGTLNEWILGRQQSEGVASIATSITKFGKDWLMVIVEGFAMFFVDGVQIFSYTYTPNMRLPNVGKPVLTLTKSGNFDDLFVLNDPQLAADFLDGLGSQMQRIEYQGSNANSNPQPSYFTIGAGVLTDVLGRPAYQRNAENAPLQLALAPNNIAAQLLLGNEDTYLVNAQGTHLTVQQYLAGQGGVYDYTTTQYENSPLNRIVSTIMPREVGADVTNFSVRYAYLSNTASGPGSVMQDLLPSGQENRYHLRQVTDPNSVNHYTLFDQAGRVVALRTALGNNAYHTTFFSYDSAGNPALVHQPNYYAPPNGSQATDWQQTRTFDFLGRLSAYTTPNTHTKRFLYDDASHLRFEQSAEDAVQSPQRVRYFKYDLLGRVVERGYLQDATYTWGSSALQNQVNNRIFPNVEHTQQPAYAQGQWYQKQIYDASPTQADIPNLLGRLYQVQTNHVLPGLETETFSYDASGNITAQVSLIANFDSSPYTVNYRYNNLNDLTEITYPRLTSDDALNVAYYYNRLGQVASVGDVLDGSEVIDPTRPATAGEKYYAAYTYNQRGDVASESLNNGKGQAPGVINPNSFTRTYGYTPQGWLASIDDPYLTETLNYYQGAGNKYYNGNIADVSFRYKTQQWNCPPSDYNYAFTYDALDRLTQANNSLNDAWNLHAPSFDADNNRLTLQQGATTTTYHYAPAGQNQHNDQVAFLSGTASSSLALESLESSPPPAAPWSWGANNGGPSASAVVTDSERGKVLKLVGGSLGHYEYVRLQTYLDPAGTYTLSYQVKTEADFASGVGQVAWVLRFFTPTGEIVTKPIAIISGTAGAWDAQSVVIDIPALRAAQGLNAAVTYVVIECVNYLRSGNNGLAPAIYLAAPTVAIRAETTGSNYGYDQDGNVIAAPATALTTLSYNAVTNLPESITLANGNHLVYAYNSANQRSLELYRTANNTNLATVRTLRSYDGQPLLRIEATGATHYIYGPTGQLADQQTSAISYLIRDHLGSPRAQVAGDTAQVTGSYDYLLFGGLMRIGQNPNLAYRYTGQEFDAESGLYNYNARLYEPALGRFLAADQFATEESPYTYVGNNPLNRVDPTGNQDVPLVEQDAFKQGKSTVPYSAPLPGQALTFTDAVKHGIFQARQNIHELNPIPRQDMSLGDWLLNAPAWIYLPYLPFSPTELWTVGIHFGLSPLYTLSPLNIFYKSMTSTMAARGYMYAPPAYMNLPVTFLKKLVLRTGYRSLMAYYNLFKKFKQVNQEARDFRRDLASDPWVKNSYRHAYWICRYTQEWGADFALALGYAHEYAHLDLTIEGPFDSVVDKINNLAGAKLGLISGGDCGILVNQTGNAQALGWAKSYQQDPITQLHLPTEFNIQKPLDMLWRNYAELPHFDSYDLGALRLLNTTLPS